MELTRSDTAGIKGIAILFMLWHHQFLNTTEYGAFTLSLAVVFKVCVALFLFVGGYGLTRQYDCLDRRNIRTMGVLLLRRFINFFLPYWFCFVLVVLVGNLFGYSFQDAYPPTRNTMKCIFLDFFGQMGYSSYLHPWWFNKMIIQLYLIFPFLYLLLCNKYTAWIGLALIVPLQLYAKSIPGSVFCLVEGGIPAFYLGMISARRITIPSVPGKVWPVVLKSVAIISVVGLAVLHNHVLAASPYRAVLIRALLAVCIVWVFKSFEGSRIFLFPFLGKYSAMMYLTHVLLMLLVPSVIYYPKSSFLAFIIFAVGSLSVSIVIDGLQQVSHYDKLRLALVNSVSKL